MPRKKLQTPCQKPVKRHRVKQQPVPKGYAEIFMAKVRNSEKRRSKQNSERMQDDKELNNKFSFNNYNLANGSHSAQNSTYKTQLCRNYQTFGSCFYNDRCLFAHGIDDLSPHVRSQITYSGSRLPISIPSGTAAIPMFPVGLDALQAPINPRHQTPLHIPHQGQNGHDGMRDKTQERRIKYKTAMCRTVLAGAICPYGKACLFAHDERDLRCVENHSLYKSVRCQTFHRDGFCKYGEMCHYIHDEDDEDLKKDQNSENFDQQQQPISVSSAGGKENGVSGAKNNAKIAYSNSSSDVGNSPIMTKASPSISAAERSDLNIFENIKINSNKDNGDEQYRRDNVGDDYTPANGVSRDETVNKMMSQLSLNSPVKPEAKEKKSTADYLRAMHSK